MKICAVLLGMGLALAGCSSELLPPVVDAGCDVPTTDDVSNCGACGVACKGEHASMDCDLGICVVDQCEPGFEDADRDPATGCEAVAKREAP